MSKTDWSNLLIKVFAVIQVFGGIVNGAIILGYGILFPLVKAQQVIDTWAYALVLLTGGTVFPVLAGIFLWRKAETISAWMWRETGAREKRGNRKSSRPNLFNLKKAAITGIGVFFFITLLPKFLGLIADAIIKAQVFLQNQEETLYILGSNPQRLFTFEDYIIWFSTFVQLFITLFLIASPTRVIVFLDKVQNTWDLLIE